MRQIALWTRKALFDTKEAPFVQELAMTDTQAQTIRQRAEVMNLRLLVWMRWFAIAGMTIAVTFVHAALQITLPIWPIAGLLVFLVAVNLVAAWRLRRPGGALSRAVVADLMVDVGALTLILYWTGGGTNPFNGLFILQAIVAAFLLPPIQAGVIFIATVVAQLWLLNNGLPIDLPMHHSHAGPSAFDLHLQGMFLSFFFSAALAVLFILGIKDNLASRDARLERLARQIEEEKVVLRLGLMAGTAAHDLGTPLSSLAVILDDWVDLGLPPPDRQMRQIAAMQTAVATCRERISHMLTVGGRPRLDEAHGADPVALVREVAEDWAGGTPVTIRDDRPGPGGVVLADVLLTRALANLFDNAREAGAKAITVAVRDAGAQTLIVVQDDGCGFPQAILQGAEPEPGPHGLGLFLVRSALRRMGGGLSLANRPEGGAEVTLHLPRIAHG
ncbi:ATP-binding protein [Stagnihabitans tardus]|uniref:histidine kinase n=1 Tax=Stagnihabitans tardus TaxID=2699202 RepID=A0AAE4YFZ0_9RHOB|nr:ATP-binding protein [Stagnihabitans tardus]NBZ89489.1 hypothetical protein [Stagnihabitans tardus]